MATFIMAMTINPNAKKSHPNLSHTVSETLDVFRRNEIRVTNLYATLGRYDYLAVFDAADQALAFKLASELNNSGILETETWPVIPYEDFSQIIG
ncbi:GYD domain-containing protein [candidate division GN15 bacterium]|nr:GYD domain-containing protein [candidate division GN15 bacterium]